MIKNQDESSTPILVSLIPNLMEGKGHIVPYHQAVSQAVSKLGWKHLAAIPSKSKVGDVLAEWDDCLSNFDLEKEGNFWQKILRLTGVFYLGTTTAKYLRNNVIYQSELSIVFLERFIHLQLLALTIALWLVPTKNLSVWLLYRRNTHKDKTRYVYKFLNYLIKKSLPAGNLKLLTDSDLLGQSLSNYFQEHVTVIPIPHTEIKIYNCDIKNKLPGILCWWPGFPREEKGWNIIKKLVDSNLNNSDEICLVAAKKSNLEVTKGGIKLKLIQDELTRKEYNYWLSVSDVILLPYDCQSYGERTSGIFTESIIAGKIPLVTDKTWMAYELLKYDLGELIINWEIPEEVFISILRIIKYPNIKNKIKAMQNSYLNYHCLNRYAEVMQKIINHK
ncbi:MAG: glycosyltransferase family 1 protein [cyanobacterium endosymbiont of Epithemia adnata isolate EadnSB Bon19]